MIRTATADDLPLVRELVREFNEEIPDVSWHDSDVDEDLESIEQTVAAGGVLLAGDDGIAVVRKTHARAATLDLLHVRPRARRQGIATALLREAAALARGLGAEALELEVLSSNAQARAMYDRFGFEPFLLELAAPVGALERRLAERPSGPTLGAAHVQTDDVEKVRRDASKVLRIEPDVEQFGDWVRVRSEATDADPKRLKALAKELSYTTGGVVLSLGIEEGAVVRYNLYDRGADIDEYLSVPEYYGELPPGDVIALGSNPTVVARLTGADPKRVREVARTGKRIADLPSAQELYEQIADTMGVTV